MIYVTVVLNSDDQFSNLFHHVRLRINAQTASNMMVIASGSFIHNTTYKGRMVRQLCAMIPRATLNISSLNLLLGSNDGSLATTRSCTGFHQPQGLTVL